MIVENFERLPAHDATGGLNVCSHTDDDGDDGRGQQETKGGEGGDGVSAAGPETSVADQSDAVSGGGAGIGGVSGDGVEESKLEAGEDGQAPPQQQQREGRVIPAKFLQLISAGLSTDLDPKV